MGTSYFSWRELNGDNCFPPQMNLPHFGAAQQ
jgi:hypothetical protein